LDTIENTDIHDEMTLRESSPEIISDYPGTFRELSNLISQGGTIKQAVMMNLLMIPMTLKIQIKQIIRIPLQMMQIILLKFQIRQKHL